MSSRAHTDTEQLAQHILDSEQTVIFTGAGVSTESGLPDFRSEGGIWDKFDPQEMTYQNFTSSQQHRRKYWQFYLQLWEGFCDAQPNAAHRSIARLQQDGFVSMVITQNVDGLHQQAGSPEERVLRIHGYMWKVHCLNCQRVFEYTLAREQLTSEATVPRCTQCCGILKPSTIAFGEPLPQGIFTRAQHYSTACDLFISIGSSLSVYPAALLPQLAQSTGAIHVIVNRDPTELDKTADLIIRGLAGTVLTRLRTLLKSSS